VCGTLRRIADGFVPVVMVRAPSVSGERCFSKLSDPLQAGSLKRVSRDADHGCDVFHRMSCCDVTTTTTQIHTLVRLTFGALVQCRRCMCCLKPPSSQALVLCCVTAASANLVEVRGRHAMEYLATQTHVCDQRTQQQTSTPQMPASHMQIVLASPASPWNHNHISSSASA
jgi:hypothetical protein